MTEDTTVPYRFEGTVAVARVVSTYGHLETGEESGDTVRVAGRVMLLRVQGKLAFATLRDWTGEVQLFCLQAVTDRFDELKRLNLGDWIGADGEVVRTKRGEALRQGHVVEPPRPGSSWLRRQVARRERPRGSLSPA